jgi:hypothetical protein
MNPPTSSSDVLCELKIENNADIELWDITIDFTRPKVVQLKFTLPVRYVIRGWLPWRKQSSLSLIPDEMLGSPLIAAPWLIRKAIDLGLLDVSQTPLLGVADEALPANRLPPHC